MTRPYREPAPPEPPQPAPSHFTLLLRAMRRLLCPHAGRVPCGMHAYICTDCGDVWTE